MKASTFIRLQAKFKLAGVRIDEDGNIQPDYGAAYFLLLLTYLGLSGYFLYLRYSSIDVVTFNTMDTVAATILASKVPRSKEVHNEEF